MGETVTQFMLAIGSAIWSLLHGINRIRRQFLDKITPTFVQRAVLIWKESGWKGVVKKYGWKFFAVFFVYYLVRDILLYVVLPYLLFTY